MLSAKAARTLPLALVAANIVGGFVFIFAEMLVPSFIVYPIFLIGGSIRLVRGDERRASSSSP